ncbi:MAG: hypothetical protein Q8868_02550 [Bacteroidota bacterium]|nr:hypothetical protein [Bacteroidota bacterium]
MKILLKIILLLSITAEVLAQEAELSETITSIAEELAEDENNAESAELYVEKLYDLTEKPVRLNSADEKELSRLFFLTDFQIKALADYIHSSGVIYSAYEIANITGFNRELAETMIPFITIDKARSSSGDSVRIKNRLLASFITRFPRSDTSFSGSPYKLLTRYKLSAGKVAVNITSEKDSGEKLLAGKPPLPDFISGNLSWSGEGIIRKVIIGDFGARFGMGTNLNTSIRTGLSLTSPGYMSGDEEIRPYTSTDENNFFRGAALQLHLNKTGISGYISSNKIDATIISGSDSSGYFIKSFYRAGLHNTLVSSAKKDIITESAFGINLTYDLKKSTVGLLWSNSRFSLPVIIPRTENEDVYGFQGRSNSIISACYRTVFSRVVLYGELSSNPGKSIAFIQGLSFRPADRLSINLLWRSFDPGFISFHGSSPFSSSSGNNLKGIFGNFTFEAAKHLFISAGCDLRYYPWMRYRCCAPSLGTIQEAKIRYLPGERLTAEIRWNFRSTMLNDPELPGIYKQEKIISRAFRGSLNYLVLDNLSLYLRLDYKAVNKDRSKGWLLLQDIKYRFRSFPVTIWYRYCIFRTDDWNSRLYAFENDLLYSMSIPALSGSGSRSYIMVSCKAGKFMDLRIKYGITEIKASGKPEQNQELKAQLRLLF